MDQREAMAALDKAITKLEVQAESDEDMALALEVVQAERAEAEYDGEFGAVEPKEPVRKEVAAGAAGGAALVLTWILSEVGVNVPGDVQAAIAVLVAAGAAYLKSENFFVG